MRLALATALAAVLLTALPFTRAEARWYLAHMGQEICLPLDDLGPGLARAYYYGGGSMKVPEDFVARLQSLGIARMRRRHDHDKPWLVVYEATFLGRFASDAPMEYVFFNDRGICRRIMSLLEP